MTAGAPVIDLAGLVKAYGRTLAVDGVDLTVAAGEVVGLLGPNGAGKSTTIDMMLGLTRPDEGSVRIFGGKPYDAVRRGRMGAMLQDGRLPPDLTVRELLRMVAALTPAPMPVADALELAGIADLAGRRADRLSGGQAQRVRFALAVVPDPDVLVLDEPTAGMDVESRLAFWASMRAQAAAGRTVVFATHYLEEADEHADRIVVIRSGRIVADGSATQIKSVVAERVIRATLPAVPVAALEALSGVTAATVRGDSVELRCADSDTALRHLLADHPGVRDIEVSGGDLTDAFVALAAADAHREGSPEGAR